MPFWWGTLILEEALNVWKQGEWGKSLYLPPNFAVNLVCSVMSDSSWHQTVAHWVLYLFSRQEYWVGCYFLLLGNLPNSGIVPVSLTSPALTDGFFTTTPWKRKWQPTPARLPGKSHGQRSLVGYGPWSHKESDTTERLHFPLPLVPPGKLWT